MNYRKKCQPLILVVILFLLSSCVSTAVPPRLTPPPEGVLPIVPRPMDSFVETYAVYPDGALYDLFWRYRAGEIAGEIEKTKILDDVVNVRADQDMALAIQSDGTLWGWGVDFRNRLPPHPDSETPVLILEDVVDVTSNAYYCLALKNDGTVWAFGQISNLAGYGYHEPVQIMDDTVQVGGGHFAIQSDGSLWGLKNIWGGEGEIRYQPMQIADHISYADGDLSGILVIKDDGSLWSIPELPGERYDPNLAVKRADHVLSAGGYLHDGEACIFVLQEDGTLWSYDSSWREKPVKLMEQVDAVEGYIDLFLTTRSGELWVYCSSPSKPLYRLLKAEEWWSGGRTPALVGLNAANGVTYMRCRQRVENKSCPGPGTLTRQELETSVYEKMREFQTLRGNKAEGYNPKLPAARAKLAKIETEIGKLIDTLTGANPLLLQYANSRIEELDAEQQKQLMHIHNSHT